MRKWLFFVGVLIVLGSAALLIFIATFNAEKVFKKK